MSEHTGNHITNGNHTTAMSNGRLAPPGLSARAAEVLGLDHRDDLATTGSELIMVTITGPRQRHHMMVQTDVPVGALAPSLGEAVGVTVISHVALRGGEVVLPTQTLGELGVRTGSQLFVVPPGRAGEEPLSPPFGHRGPQQPWARAAKPRRGAMGGSRTPTSRTPTQWAVLGGFALAVIVVAMLIGGALFGSGSPAPTNAPSAAQALAARAATAWVNATPFSGERMSNVAADLGRSGPPSRGTIETAGSSTSNGITSQLFIVAPPAGPVYGLSVVVYNGRIAYPVTVAALPFATSVPPGKTPLVPQSGRIVPPTAQRQAQSWAAAVFGTPIKPIDGLGYGLNGSVKVLTEWRPKSGAATVGRVSVPLAGTAPGTPAATNLSVAQGAVSKDRAAVSAAQAALDASIATIKADNANLANANTAAQAAVTASNTANPPNPPPLAAAVAAAQQAATGAQAALTADEHAQVTNNAALTAAQQAQTTAINTVKTVTAAGLASTTSVYDVAFDASGRSIAWAPADYQIGQS